MGDTGLEPVNVTACNDKHLQNQPKTGDAESGALSGNSTPNLAELTKMLSGLSNADKAKLAAALTGNAKGKQL